ncbi:unnamed protein product [Mytilus edulis]|uniref:Uncharacterized protein n=1 Tax=Mytilus edulis TaxID=6550 RepID=A0A8S3TLX9_MYTED|nr:unnamed protein product [Mytilus edulis]
MTLNVWKTLNNDKPCSQEYYIDQITEIYGQSLTGQVQEAISMYQVRQSLTEHVNEAISLYQEIKNKNDIEIRKNINKLSFRQRCKATLTVDEIRQREKQYVNDAIIIEKKRTKYKDIIPVYDASNDDHCKAYFNRPDVKRLVTKTCSARKPLYRI